MAEGWRESRGKELDRHCARESYSQRLPTRATVLLKGGKDPVQHGSCGKASWATQAGDLGVPAIFDHSVCGTTDFGLRSWFITRNGWSGQMTNMPGTAGADEETKVHPGADMIAI